MAINNIRQASGPIPSTNQRQVVAGTNQSIIPGQFLQTAVNSPYVSAATVPFVVGTNLFAGIAQSNSTETTTSNGTVGCVEITSMNQEYYIPFDSAVGTLTQSQYNALVGKFVNFTVTNGIMACLATHGATNPFIIRDSVISPTQPFAKVMIRQSALFNN